MKVLFLATFVVLPCLVNAEVAEVYQWKAFPGKQEAMLLSMAKAAEIHRAQGAQVSINAHNIGSTQMVDYVLRWDDTKKYAQSKDEQANSEAWVKFWAEVSGNPAGELVASFAANNLDQSKKASDFDGSYCAPSEHKGPIRLID